MGSILIRGRANTGLGNLGGARVRAAERVGPRFDGAVRGVDIAYEPADIGRAR